MIPLKRNSSVEWKDMEHSIEIVNKDDDGKGPTTVDDGDKSGRFLCLLRIIDTKLMFNVTF